MTSRNLTDFERGIELRSLPKTIRYTIEIVQQIGFWYLWIDALCIMQDGSTSTVASNDWLDQVKKLHDIFENAVATIVVAESFDGNQGLI